ncbi:MAG: DEAD/DEAH box helicase [Oscillospiraceae bacterium]|nr:DEAD/DEAH box helicase [Oscillospiraceae bacterium]
MSLELFSKATQNWFRQALGEPTPVQEQAWRVISEGKNALVSAPTGTGKTLSAFLVFIDKMFDLAGKNQLEQRLYLIYISPLKALAGDIRENLYRPLDGIGNGFAPIDVFVRTGDTTQAERRKMLKKPPHILITTPESLFLLLTSQSGREFLKSATAIIADELHAMMNSKRGAHFMLSLARLDKLCEKPLQRIGLSATVNPLELAADYLSCGDKVEIIAPKMQKEFDIIINGAKTSGLLPKGTVWTEIARMVYEQCEGARSAIAFADGRMFSEKLAFYVNQTAGEHFALTHHGCVSKEQRQAAEKRLKSGDLRLLCATSSMELGIDVGEIDKVLQIGAPATISSLLQRLGRAGHNPGRKSVMHLFPKTAADGLICGLTAHVAKNHGIEPLNPPRLCFDILAQHLVSMASAADGYTVDDVMELLPRAYPFREVTREDVKSILEMLAGDYEHERDLPVRARVLYDRINERVESDSYSRMLATRAGGTIPDTGMYAVKTESGVKLGELDEEFVFESRVGEKFLLGSFAWKITQMNKDTVVVKQAKSDGARPPFYRTNWLSRNYYTALLFGEQMQKLSLADNYDEVLTILYTYGMDQNAAAETAGYLIRQKEALSVLPNCNLIIAEHFRDESGDNQLMLHSIFGKQINSPLGFLMQNYAEKLTGAEVVFFDDDDGILLYVRGKHELPNNLVKIIADADNARNILEALLPVTPLFGIAFRHNAARALIMGMRKSGRQPLWVQRLRGAETLDMLIAHKNHPLIRETMRECLEDYWNLGGLSQLLLKIRRGEIEVREVVRDEPSPMSLPLRRQAEGVFTYDYFPSSKNINQSVEEALQEELKHAEIIKPASEFLAGAERKKLPENPNQLHALLMREGDLEVGESRDLGIPFEWFEGLLASGRIAYIEPGLWIAAEHENEYRSGFEQGDTAAIARVIRRCIYFRGGFDASMISARYSSINSSDFEKNSGVSEPAYSLWDCYLPAETAAEILQSLASERLLIEDDGLYYHADLYEKARRKTIAFRRREFRTMPPQNYAALLAEKVNPRENIPASEQLETALLSLSGRGFPVALWENVLLPARVKNYNGGLLDKLLSEGKCFWKLSNSELSFEVYEDVDYEFEVGADLDGDEAVIFEQIRRRGAVFLSSLSSAVGGRPLLSPTLSLVEKGLIRADSFIPVRQLQDKDKLLALPLKQRIAATVRFLNAGRFDIARPVVEKNIDEQINRAFDKVIVLCRETALQAGLNWSAALEKLRVWEYTGKARRGYFIEGLSGAQFIRDAEFAGVIHRLENPKLSHIAFPLDVEESGNAMTAATPPSAANGGERSRGIHFHDYKTCNNDIICLNAADPFMPWGKCLAHLPGRAFTCVSGTIAALCGGVPVALLEKQGQVLRVFDEELTEKAVFAFAECYKKGLILPNLKRLVVKEYPREAEGALKGAGFMRLMLEWGLFR